MGIIPIMNSQASLGEKVLRFEGKKDVLVITITVSLIVGCLSDTNTHRPHRVPTALHRKTQA